MLAGHVSEVLIYHRLNFKLCHGERTSLADVDQDFSSFDLDRIIFEIDANRRSLCGTVAIVKPAIVLGAFDDVVHHQPISKMDLFMGAETIGGLELIVG
jgi:hypothetical protein